MPTTPVATGVELAWEAFGSPADPTVLLVMGLGAQMIAWDDELCEQLAGAGHHVIRFDNRDSGLSTHVPSAYTLSDLAADTVGLLAALDLPAAHLVGASMGGMIVQTVAVEHPARVLSLTSIMSTTGRAEDTETTPAAAAALASPPAPDVEAAAERAVLVWRVLGSPAYPRPEEELRERARRAWARDSDPTGFVRQYAAINTPGQDRTEALGRVGVPTLIVHGEDDPLLGVRGGRATAAAVPGSELWVVPGMGHDLPPAVWPELIARVGAVVARGEAQAAASR